MAELRQKIYSKKRMMMANVIAGMATGGGLQDTFIRMPAVLSRLYASVLPWGSSYT